MSNFKCEHCGTDILEDAGGRYVTYCEHYPLDKTQPNEQVELLPCGKCGHAQKDHIFVDPYKLAVCHFSYSSGCGCEEFEYPSVARPVPHPGGDLALARKFHDTYERLAPQFGYETRPDTKEFDPDSPNGKLMIAVVGEVARTLPLSDSFQEYIRANIVEGKIDFHFRARVLESGAITFYVHPQDKDGETRDYLVYGDNLQLVGILNPRPAAYVPPAEGESK